VYSVVLMMAMTSSPDMAAFGRRNGCDGGCRGGGGCYGGSCYGGGSSCYGGNGCRGGRGGHKARGGRGCHGGGGCYGGGGGCYGGYGGGCHGGYGGGCHGGYGGGYAAVGCHGGYGGGCWGGAASYSGAPMGATVAPQPAPAPMPKPPAGTTTPPSDVRLPGAATIVVSLPEGAKLMVDGAATRSTAAVRTFTTPNLNAGQNYFYTLTAEIERDGQKLTATEQVTVRANETTNVSLPDTKFAQTVTLK
jgi:uncharacterized protein (TIGR03000 family)